MVGVPVVDFEGTEIIPHAVTQPPGCCQASTQGRLVERKMRERTLLNRLTNCLALLSEPVEFTCPAENFRRQAQHESELDAGFPIGFGMVPFDWVAEIGADQLGPQLARCWTADSFRNMEHTARQQFLPVV